LGGLWAAQEFLESACLIRYCSSYILRDLSVHMDRRTWLDRLG